MDLPYKKNTVHMKLYFYNFSCQNYLMVLGGHSHNNKFKQIRNAWHFWFESALVFTAQFFR